MTRRSRAGARGQKADEAEQQAKGKSLWPLYLIGGLIAAALVASMVLKDNARTGDVGLGGHCQATSDCRDKRDVCYRGEGRATCVRKCQSDPNDCMPGTKCESVGSAKGRRSLRVQKLCVPD
jgi:hypothetical protein